MQKTRELFDEFKNVVLGKNNLVDVILPTLVFLVLDALGGFNAALWGSLVVAAGFTIFRVWKKQSPVYALVGLVLAAFATLTAFLAQTPQVAFLPGILTNALTVLAAVASNLAGRPLVAFTSHLTRGWALNWYWHPRVRPAYSEVTWLWALFFAAKLAVQMDVYLAGGSASRLAWINLWLGWPALVVLLVVSYVYGLWRLQRLQGPGLEEFVAGAPPPWKSQVRGF
jgi:hypothetical protein